MENSLYAYVPIVISLVALVGSIATAIILFLTPTQSDTQRQYNELQTEFTDFFDKVNKWMRRDATRVARAGKEINSDLQVEGPNIDKKALLRQKVRNLQAN